MLALFIWGFALYGLAMAIWQLILYGMHKQKPAVPVTAVLVVHEGATYMEGMLRSLTTNQEFMRRPLKIVVIDCGSEDETGIIVEKFAQRMANVHLIRTEQPRTALLDVVLQDDAMSCVFDLRGPVAPSEVVPTLFAFCHERQV
jgi:hypothetical protein